jgi:hypothetical protein
VKGIFLAHDCFVIVVPVRARRQGVKLPILRRYGCAGGGAPGGVVHARTSTLTP